MGIILSYSAAGLLPVVSLFQVKLILEYSPSANVSVTILLSVLQDRQDQETNSYELNDLFSCVFHIKICWHTYFNFINLTAIYNTYDLWSVLQYVPGKILANWIALLHFLL